MMKQKLISIFILFSNCLYKETSFSNANLETYLNTILFPKLTKEKSKTLDSEITEKKLLIVLQRMENNKSPGNDGLTKEFHITFWNDVKIPLLLAIEGPSCKTNHCIAKASRNKINRKERRRGIFKTGDLFPYLK